jgi:hypothetical protein
LRKPPELFPIEERPADPRFAPIGRLNKKHCRLDPHYLASFAVANLMNLHVVHPRHLDTGSYQTS